MGLVEDQERAGREVAEPVAQRAGVGLVEQEAVRDEEAACGCVQGLTPKPRSRRTPGDVVAVEDLEDEAEAALQLVLPLQERRTAGAATTIVVGPSCRRSSSRAIRPASIVLPRPTSSAMKRFDARQPERLAQRLELVGVDLDAGAEGRLEEAAGRSR